MIELVPPKVVIEYQKLAFNGTRTAFMKSFCRPCRWHPSVGRFTPATERSHTGVDGMCAGTEIHSPSSSFRKRSKSKYRMMLNFNVDRGTSQWTTCTLTFSVSVRFLAIQHADFVKRVMDKQFIIARSANMPNKPVIDYEILSNKAKKDGYSNAVCWTCHWDPMSGRFIIASLAPPTVGSSLPTTAQETHVPISVLALTTGASSSHQMEPSDLYTSHFSSEKTTSTSPFASAWRMPSSVSQDPSQPTVSSSISPVTVLIVTYIVMDFN